MAQLTFPFAQQPQYQQMNPAVSRLFQAVNQPMQQNTLRRGALVTFRYSMWVHDPYPLLMVSDVYGGKMIRGVNLHYLTFPFIKSILQSGCGQNFSYKNFRTNNYIVGAFRSYKWNGVSQIRVLDCNYLLNVMATVRSFDPSQVAAIRRSVQEQINQLMNPKAGPSAEQPVGTPGV